MLVTPLKTSNRLDVLCSFFLGEFMVDNVRPQLYVCRVKLLIRQGEVFVINRQLRIHYLPNDRLGHFPVFFSVPVTHFTVLLRAPHPRSVLDRMCDVVLS